MTLRMYPSAAPKDDTNLMSKYRLLEAVIFAERLVHISVDSILDVLHVEVVSIKDV